MIKKLFAFSSSLVQFIQCYFYLLGCFVFLTVIDSHIDLKNTVSIKSLLFYMALASFLFLVRYGKQTKDQSPNA